MLLATSAMPLDARKPIDPASRSASNAFATTAKGCPIKYWFRASAITFDAVDDWSAERMAAGTVVPWPSARQIDPASCPNWMKCWIA